MAEIATQRINNSNTNDNSIAHPLSGRLAVVGARSDDNLLHQSNTFPPYFRRCGVHQPLFFCIIQRSPREQRKGSKRQEAKHSLSRHPSRNDRAFDAVPAPESTSEHTPVPIGAAGAAATMTGAPFAHGCWSTHHILKLPLSRTGRDSESEASTTIAPHPLVVGLVDHQHLRRVVQVQVLGGVRGFRVNVETSGRGEA